MTHKLQDHASIIALCVNDRKIQSDSKIPKPSNMTGYAPRLYAWFWTYKTHMTTVEGALIGQLEEVFRVGI